MTDKERAQLQAEIRDLRDRIAAKEGMIEILILDLARARMDDKKRQGIKSDS